jgi:hypothetical protein
MVLRIVRPLDGAQELRDLRDVIDRERGEGVAVLAAPLAAEIAQAAQVRLEQPGPEDRDTFPLLDLTDDAAPGLELDSGE